MSVWGDAAENLQKYQSKGDLIYVAGVLKNNVKKDLNGNKTYDLQVKAKNIKYLSKGKNNKNEDLTVNITNPFQEY